ncbi:hypothetical protein Ciccas_002248 [Cichlidogyrus casuarinus]|uniref:Uncharacterized protein n=1 Tax=Cichlidogyrus casuarinus TaxID=1844966 RepID=A0ABD2QHT3_9PLAT
MPLVFGKQSEAHKSEEPKATEIGGVFEQVSANAWYSASTAAVSDDQVGINSSSETLPSSSLSAGPQEEPEASFHALNEWNSSANTSMFEHLNGYSSSRSQYSNFLSSPPARISFPESEQHNVSSLDQQLANHHNQVDVWDQSHQLSAAMAMAYQHFYGSPNHPSKIHNRPHSMGGPFMPGSRSELDDSSFDYKNMQDINPYSTIG